MLPFEEDILRETREDHRRQKMWISKRCRYVLPLFLAVVSFLSRKHGLAPYSRQSEGERSSLT
jgi:hypothetical protein